VTLVGVHARLLTLELARHPAYVVPTLAMPTLFFLFFGLGGPAAAAAPRMAAFAGFAAIGVAFFQFGVGIATDRASPWELFLRALPAPDRVRLAARAASAAAFAAAAAGILVAVAAPATGVSLPAAAWAELAATLVAGSAPFALLGIAIGYWVPSRGALPAANLLYLLLSYAGGLWVAPERLPAAVRAVSPALPTRAYADALAAAVTPTGTAWRSWLALAAFTACFGALAAWGYRRDEGSRYR
jgi:ABC-2 type transport system permease protein